MIVITLTKVPPSLRGDLTKWYQEIQTGVYVGNVSARIRDLLWDRILQNIGRGEATMVYNAKNELGYQFETTRKDRDVIDFDGIPLLMHLNVATGEVNHGFSNAAKFRQAKTMTRKVKPIRQPAGKTAMVALDLETTGVDATQDAILSIGAVRRSATGQVDHFYKLIRVERQVPASITTLTGITAKMLAAQGISLKTAIEELRAFVGELAIVGYNLRFDESFLATACKHLGLSELSNRMVDLMPFVKKTNHFLDNYRLQTVLAEYDIDNKDPHNSLADAQATFDLADKLTKVATFQI